MAQFPTGPTSQHISEGDAVSDLGPDLATCDREPIHIPGSIQPHGLLLVADAATMRVVGGAGAIEDRLAPDWLGRPLAEVLGLPVPADRPPGPLSLGRVEGRAGVFEAVAHAGDGVVAVELEPTSATVVSATSVLAWLDDAGGVFERAANLRELCERAATIFRDLTGFDRVMIYRFLDDEAGVVVAEACDPALNSFLNHHFPASDIPRQARALYVRNRVRVIPDVDYVPAPLRPAEAGLAGLDLSDVDLRSVSPIHLQYLKNMGLAASASVSIVKDGLLWGLVACHNATPRMLGYSQRLTCRTLAGGLARQIQAKEEAEEYRERLRLRTAEDAIVGRLAVDQDTGAVFAQGGDEFRRMLGADGFAALVGGDLHLSGRCPPEAGVREIAAWLRRGNQPQPFATHRLTEQCPAAHPYRDSASGLIALTLSLEEPTILMWFRAEALEVVNWAGNPHKAVQAVPGAVLTPRTSFALWSEEMHGHARPWTAGEIEAVRRMNRLLFEARQSRRIRELIRELTATVADKESLLVQKDYLLKEVNHRIQNSLQLVSAFLGLQARAVGDDVLTAHLGEAQRRLSAVSLVHRRLYGDDSLETIDLGRYLDELCDEMKLSMGEEWGRALSFDLAPVLVSADRAVTIGLILTELVINANKYAYDGGPGPLAITLEQHRNRFRLIVADRGPGKVTDRRADEGPGRREGFGTRMLRAMVERLAGTLEEADNRPGLRVIVTAPVGE